MTQFQKRFYLLPAILGTILAASVQAQQEGEVRTQALVSVEAKTTVIPAQSNVTIKVDNRSTPLISINRVPATGAEVALLIDDGLRVSVGRELDSLRNFVKSLPPGTSIFIGYMQNGRVVPAQNFTYDFAAAAQALRVPMGSPGQSASPYLCLSDFVKKWPSAEADPDTIGAQTPRKARFVLMITDGVDPYNGSTRITNQDSPYVAAAVTDAQRSGIPVYSVYFSDAGIRGGQANFSGQSYLSQIADATGGRAYYTGTGNPVSMTPFLEQFKKAVAETYIATFNVPGGKNLVRVKLATSLPGTKLQTATQVRPGTRITN